MSRLFGKAVHAGFTVPDVDAAIARMLAIGVGPAYTMRRIRVPARYRGERHDVLISAAFVYSGTMQYEFVQQHDATPSAYLEHLERHPQGGLHHLAYFCDSFDAAFTEAAQAGCELAVVQEFIGADEAPYEMYTEPKNGADPVLIQLMIPSPIAAMFDEMERVAADWDGSAPVRDALALLPPEMRPPTEA